MTDQIDIARVAAGLTDKARAAVRAVPDNGMFPYSGERWRLLPSLYRKGLVTQSMVPARLTPLGLRLRAHLQGEDNAGS